MVWSGGSVAPLWSGWEGGRQWSGWRAPAGLDLEWLAAAVDSVLGAAVLAWFGATAQVLRVEGVRRRWDG